MKKSLKRTLQALMVVPLFGLVLGFAALPAYADASNLTISGGASAAQGTDQQGNASCLISTGGSSNCAGQQGLFKTVTNVLLFIIGAISVIMLVVGGIRYTVSAGDQNQVTAAKHTIMYAIVGLIVAILAYAVVNFVIGSLVG